MNNLNEEFHHNNKYLTMDVICLAIWSFLFFVSINKHGNVDLLVLLFAINDALCLATIFYKLSNPAITLNETRFEAKWALLKHKIVIDYANIAKVSSNEKSFFITLHDSTDIKVPKRILNEDDKLRFVNSLLDKVKSTTKADKSGLPVEA